MKQQNRDSGLSDPSGFSSSSPVVRTMRWLFLAKQLLAVLNTAWDMPR